MVRCHSQTRSVWSRLRILAPLIASCVFLSGCANSKLAEHAVNFFHSQLNSEQYRAIYESAGVRVRSTKSESDYVKLLQDIHRRLGNVKGSTLTFENVAVSPPTVTLHYDTTFERGTAREQFAWLIKDNHAILDQYGIVYVYATTSQGKSGR
jgi:hypothetical protein